jgi:hypothetical protein
MMILLTHPLFQSFFIPWFGIYALSDGETELIRMTSHKQHSISGPKICEKRTYENGNLIPTNARRMLVVGYVEAEVVKDDSE